MPYIPQMSDVKVFVLYLMKNIPSELDFQTLSEIVVFDGAVSYFDFATAFAYLLDNSAIETVKEDGEDKYRITDMGKDIIGNTEERLLGIVKEHAVRSMLRLLAHKKNGNSIITDIVPEEGGYYFKSVIKDKIRTVFELKIFLTEEKEAEKMQIIFNEKAEVILKGIISLLSGDAKFILDSIN